MTMQPINLGNGNNFQIEDTKKGAHKVCYLGHLITKKITLPAALVVPNNKRAFEAEYLKIRQIEELFPKHPNLITFLGSQYSFFLFERGEFDLTDPPLKCTSTLFTMQQRIGFAMDVLNAIASLHAQDWVYIDLKPDNIVYANGHLKLIDFETASHITDPQARLMIGTTAYAPPELWRVLKTPHKRKPKSYDLKMDDMWRVGVITHYLFGRMVSWHSVVTDDFDCSANTDRIQQLMMDYLYSLEQENLSYPHNVPLYMLEPDPKERLSASAALTALQLAQLDQC